MSFFDADSLRAVTSGRWIQRPSADLTASGIGTDTRADLRNRVFLALAGPRFDGHDHLDAAQSAGAVLAIVSRDEPGPLPALLVPDTRRALAQLATAYRRTLRATKVIAITGSCGKTTTKELIHALLSTRFTGSAAPRSFNNDIGVPLTLLAARPHDKYLVVEIGTNAPGEIAHLARMVEPDIAVITSIGRSHLEGFGSVAAVAEEKASLLASLRPDGLAILPSEAPALEAYLPSLPAVIRFGVAADADLRLTDRGIQRTEGGAAVSETIGWFEVNGRVRFDLALPGRHNALNALAAVGIGRRLGLTDDGMSDVLAQVAPAPMRMVRETIPWSQAAQGTADPSAATDAPVTVINDAYNANPESMIAALDTFIELAPAAPRRIVVLGDMLELGDESAALHREMGLYVIDVDSRRRLDFAFLIGPEWAHGEASIRRIWPASRVTRYESLDAPALAAITRAVRPGDAMLVKGSRGLGLERVIDAVRSAAGGSSTPEIEIADGLVSRTETAARPRR